MQKFKVKSVKDVIRDLLSGVVIALVSVPLSMGYAQVAGLPAQYGLYGSLFPVLIFGLLTTSPRFVFGIDAAPAALVGSLLTELGIVLGSEEAISFVPVVTMLTALWLGLFWLLRGGRFVKYISESVLGGCVSGIASIVILMQFPKLFGGTAAVGRAPGLLLHIIDQTTNFHALSFALGTSTVILILFSRSRWPRISMSVILMVVGILLTTVFHIDRYGVALLPAAEWGLPKLSLPDFTLLNENIGRVMLSSLTMALVILSETLLSTRHKALEYNDKINNQREILSYAAGNFAAAICGSSPASGSISRTKRANQFHVSSQWMSVSIFVTTGFVLLFFTKFISYLPVPILAGIVIASLASMLEYELATELWKLDRANFFIFMGAFLAEFLGLMEGVLVGVILSFASFTMRSSTQPRYFLGCLKGEHGFYDLRQTLHARPIEHTVMYQFNGALFFANIEDFIFDIEGSLREDIRLVVVSGITSIDLTAAKRLLKLYRELKERNISLYLAGHVSAVNEQLIRYGAEELIHNCAVKPRFTEALSAGGLTPPYPLARTDRDSDFSANATLEAFTWAYGKYAGPRLKILARKLTHDIVSSGENLDLEKIDQVVREVAGEYWNAVDEEEFLNLLEMNLALASCAQEENKDAFRELSRTLFERRLQLERQLLERGDVDMAKKFIQLRLRRESDFQHRHPEACELLISQREEYLRELQEENPALVRRIYDLARQKNSL